jgi:hypothetical protein
VLVELRADLAGPHAEGRKLEWFVHDPFLGSRTQKNPAAATGFSRHALAAFFTRPQAVFKSAQTAF